MDVVEVRTQELAGMAAPYNPRKISDHDLDALRRSLRFFGTVEPIVVNRRSGHIVGGHQRVKAAQAEGIEELPVYYVDLDDPSERQLNLALNRIHGEWDEDLLERVLAELKASGADLELTGFSDEEIGALLVGTDVPQEGLTDPDAIPEPPDEPMTQRGDLIVLGQHRLLCADCGNPMNVEMLLGDERIHLVNTDPPYNVKVEPRSNNAIAAAIAAGRHQKNDARPDRKASGLTHHQSFDLARDKVKSKPTGPIRPRDRELVNDFIPPEEFAKKLRDWFKNMANALEPGRSFYIWGGYANLLNYPAAFLDAGLYFSQGIIWDKQWPVLTRKDFMGAHEWAFYGWKEGAAHFFNPEITNAQDIWRVRKVAPPAMIHLTEKPVELAELAMTYSSKRGEHVLDLFGGSALSSLVFSTWKNLFLRMPFV